MKCTECKGEFTQLDNRYEMLAHICWPCMEEALDTDICCHLSVGDKEDYEAVKIISKDIKELTKIYAPEVENETITST